MKFIEFNFTSLSLLPDQVQVKRIKHQHHRHIKASKLIFDLLARRRQERAMTYSCRTATS